MKTWQDDRSIIERSTHNVLIAGRDRFLSSWGIGKENGGSTAVWSCTRENYSDVLQWVNGRSDMTHIRSTTEIALRKIRGMVHIYKVGDRHPAVDGCTLNRLSTRI